MRTASAVNIETFLRKIPSIPFVLMPELRLGCTVLFFWNMCVSLCCVTHFDLVRGSTRVSSGGGLHGEKALF